MASTAIGATTDPRLSKFKGSAFKGCPAKREQELGKITVGVIALPTIKKRRKK